MFFHVLCENHAFYDVSEPWVLKATRFAMFSGPTCGKPRVLRCFPAPGREIDTFFSRFAASTCGKPRVLRCFPAPGRGKPRVLRCFLAPTCGKPRVLRCFPGPGRGKQRVLRCFPGPAHGKPSVLPSFAWFWYMSRGLIEKVTRFTTRFQCALQKPIESFEIL